MREEGRSEKGREKLINVLSTRRDEEGETENKEEKVEGQYYIRQMFRSASRSVAPTIPNAIS